MTTCGTVRDRPIRRSRGWKSCWRRWAHRGTAVAPARRPWRAIAAAAAVALAAASLLRASRRRRAPRHGWQVARLDGSAQVGKPQRRSCRDGVARRTGVEDRERTRRSCSRTTRSAGSISGPNPRCAPPAIASWQLHRGRLHAFIWAAGAAVRRGYALGARGRPRMRVHDRRQSARRRPAEGGARLGRISVRTGTSRSSRRARSA